MIGQIRILYWHQYLWVAYTKYTLATEACEYPECLPWPVLTSQADPYSPYWRVTCSPLPRAEWRGTSFNRNKDPVVSLHSCTLSPPPPYPSLPFFQILHHYSTANSNLSMLPFQQREEGGVQLLLYYGDWSHRIESQNLHLSSLMYSLSTATIDGTTY